MVCQNFLLSGILLTLILLKYFSLFWHRNLPQIFASYSYPSLSDLLFVEIILSLDLSIVTFLRDLAIKAFLLKCRTFPKVPSCLKFLGRMPRKQSNLNLLANLIQVSAQLRFILVKSLVISVEKFSRITFTYSFS